MTAPRINWKEAFPIVLLGTGVGLSAGVLTERIAVWLPVGIALGVVTAVMAGRRRNPEVRIERRIEFLHEQDGENERVLKNEIRPVLASHSAVDRAYLVRVGFEPSATPSVALCLISRQPDDLSLTRKLGELFVRLAPGGVFLDVAFLNDAQESDVRRVCRPFYERLPAT